jgi:hypothetical protein
MRVLLILLFVAGAASAQTQKPPHPLPISPPAQPPVVLNPLRPQERVDLRTGEKEAARLCTREVFVPCTDERSRNCTRKEAYRCD